MTGLDGLQKALQEKAKTSFEIYCKYKRLDWKLDTRFADEKWVSVDDLQRDFVVVSRKQLSEDIRLNRNALDATSSQNVRHCGFLARHCGFLAGYISALKELLGESDKNKEASE